MTKLTFQQRFGCSPGKLILVGVLGLVFVSVIYIQFGSMMGSESETTQASATRPETKSNKRPGNRADTQATGRSTSLSTSTGKKSDRSRNSPSSRTTPKPSRTNSSRTKPPANAAPRAELKNLDTPDLIAAVTSSTVKTWPELTLDVATTHDPFSLPASIKMLSTVQLPNSTGSATNQNGQPLVPNSQLNALAEQRLRELQQQLDDKRAEMLTLAKSEFDEKVKTEQKRIADTIVKIQNNGAPIVLITEKTRVVQINDKFYLENETFDGIRIIKINDNGSIVLAPAQPPPIFVPPPELVDEESPVSNDDTSDEDVPSTQ